MSSFTFNSTSTQVNFTQKVAKLCENGPREIYPEEG